MGLLDDRIEACIQLNYSLQNVCEMKITVISDILAQRILGVAIFNERRRSKEATMIIL